MTNKWKGLKVEREGDFYRFSKYETYLGGFLITSDWFKPLRFSDGNISRPDFIKSAKRFLGNDPNKPLGQRTPIGYNYTVLMPTTGGVKLK